MVTKPTKEQPGGPHPSLLSALRAALKPLVLLMIRNGIGYPFLIQMLKGVYLECAQEECAQAQNPATDSRLSLLTGVHRKDIRRLREETPVAPEGSKSASLGAQLLSIWISRKEFLDAKGKPKALPRLESQTKGASFEGLVKTFSLDIRSRAVLDEWIRMGIVTVDEQDQVHLQMEAFVPKEGFQEKAHFFGQNVADHIRAAAHNLENRKPPLFDRSVYYNGLSENAVHLLEELFNEGAMALLKQINAKAIELQKAEPPEKATQRFNGGLYFFKGNRKNEPKK